MKSSSPYVNGLTSVILKPYHTKEIYVPPSFVGMSCNFAAAPTGMVYGSNRTWDSRAGVNIRCIPKDINPSRGVFEWGGIDSLFQNNPGKQFHVTLGCPPDWMVTRAAVGSATAYGGKSNMCPDDLDAYALFVTHLASRLKSKFGKTGLIWDLWNEMNGTGFYNDSISLLGPYTRRVVLAIKEVDPTAIILAPNTNTSSAVLTTVLETSTGDGKKIKDYCDGVSFHSYHVPFTTMNLVRSVYDTFNQMKQAAIASGMKNPQIHFNESGIVNTNPLCGKIHGIKMIVTAAMGGSTYLGYTFDHATYGISSFSTDWNYYASMLSGNYIRYCAVENGTNLVIETNKTRQTIELQ